MSIKKKNQIYSIGSTIFRSKAPSWFDFKNWQYSEYLISYCEFKSTHTKNKVCDGVRTIHLPQYTSIFFIIKIELLFTSLRKSCRCRNPLGVWSKLLLNLCELLRVSWLFIEYLSSNEHFFVFSGKSILA